MGYLDATITIGIHVDVGIGPRNLMTGLTQ